MLPWPPAVYLPSIHALLFWDHKLIFFELRTVHVVQVAQGAQGPGVLPGVASQSQSPGHSAEGNGEHVTKPDQSESVSLAGTTERTSLPLKSLRQVKNANLLALMVSFAPTRKELS